MTHDDEVERVEFTSNGRTVTLTAGQMSEVTRRLEAERGLQPKKYERGGPWIYVATRAACDCVMASHPIRHDPKAAGRVLAEWVKAGWMVRTVEMRGLRIGLCPHEIDAVPDEPVVYIAEKYCGCCVGVQPPIFGSEQGVAKIIQVWAEQGYFIQTIPLSRVWIEVECPHEPPKPHQDYLPGLAHAIGDGDDV